MTSNGNDEVVLFKFDDIEWEENPGAKEGAPSEMSKGVRRKWLAHGDGGFHVQVVEMPPGHTVQPHSHSASEVVLVLDGGLKLTDGSELGPMDSAVLLADRSYGFTVGDDGIRFMILRAAEASMSVPS